MTNNVDIYGIKIPQHQIEQDGNFERFHFHIFSRYCDVNIEYKLETQYSIGVLQYIENNIQGIEEVVGFLISCFPLNF